MTTSTPVVATPLTATLLPATDGADGAQLAVSWQKAAGASLEVVVRGLAGAQDVLVADRRLDAGVNLLALPLDPDAEGELHLRVRDGAETVTEAWELESLRGSSSFAWEAAFFGPGLDGGSSAGAGGARALTVWDDGSGPALYVGGGFVTAGPHQVDRIARWDGSEWSALAGPNGRGIAMTAGGGLASVKALLEFEGDLIVAGFFDTAGGERVDNIARWDGSEWSPLGAGLTGSIGIEALAVFDGELIAGGLFTQSGETTVNRVARWDGSQWSAVGGGVSEADFSQTPRVYALAEYQGELVVGGNFLQAGDLPVQRIARWNGSAWAPLGSGVSDASNPSADIPSVRALTVFAGELIAGGNFTKAGGLDAELIASWDGTSWSPLGGGMDGAGNPNVSVLTVYDGALIAGGNFTEAGGTTVNRIARWDGGVWSGLSGPAGTGTSSTVGALTVFDGDLIAGGQGFTLAGGVVVNAVARWDGSEWSTLSGLPGTGLLGSVNTMTLYDGDLIIGGAFVFAGGEEVHNVARWDGQEWSALDGPLAPGVTGIPGGGVTPSVNALAVYEGDLIAGGAFFDAGGLFVRHIARWDGNEWSPLGPPGSGVENTAGPPGVDALAVVDGALIVGGRFTQAGGVSVSNIVRWDGSDWTLLDTGLNGSADALIVFDGDLIAAGDFTSAGGVAAGRIARWDGSEWSPLGSGLNGWTVALTLYQGTLIAAGDFTQAGGQPASRIARWDGSQWAALGAGLNGRVVAVAAFGDALVAGGLFSQAGGQTVGRIARWEDGQWSRLAGPAGEGVGGWSNPRVAAVAVYDPDGAGPEPERLIAGGLFNLAGGVPSWNLAQYGPAAAQSHLTVLPSNVAFGGVIIGEAAETRIVTLTSLGNVPVEVDGIGAAAAPFVDLGGNCPVPPFELAPADACTLEYGFEPTETGDFEQALTIVTGTDSAVITLAGEGLPLPPPAIQIDPESFSVVLIQGETLERSLGIQNPGGEDLEWSLSSTCDLPEDLAWLAMDPVSGTVLGGTMQTAALLFDAGGLEIGEHDALLCFASNAPADPLVELPIALTVVGQPPFLAVDPESLSATLQEGGSETRPLTLANLGEQLLEWAVTEEADPPGEFPEFGVTVNALTVWDDGAGPALYVGGATSGPFNGIARWDGTQWSSLASGFDGGAVQALAVYDGDLIVGGTFTAAGGVPVPKIARWDGNAWSSLGTGMPGGGAIRVGALTVFDGELIAGGSFTEAGGVPVTGIARWNGSEWAALGSGLTTQVFALAVFDGDLIAGGGFTSVGGQDLNRIARWDGSDWSPLGAGLDSSALALTLYDGALIAAGSFAEAGGQPAGRVARWDGSQWSAVGAGINTQAGALAIYDGDLIVGGLFSEAGGSPASNIARWDGSDWSPLGAGTGGRVSAVAAFDGALIAGGSFTTAGGSPASRIASWDGSDWSPVVAVAVDCELPSWVGVEPASGTISGEEDQEVSVAFDAAELAIGDYQANLCLDSNAPAQPLTVVPLALTVEAVPAVPTIEVDPESLSATLPEGQAETQLLTIANVGEATLEWEVTEMSGAFAAVRVSAGGGHTCAVDAAGTAYCWGGNGDGQLGVGDTDGRELPTPIDATALDGPVASISAGSGHTCAVTTFGSAYCWGRNSNGQLGVNDTNPRLTPTAVVPGEMGEVVEIGTGWQHTCALDVDGKAFCWGSNFFGQLGNGDPPIERHAPWPVDQDDLGDVIHIAAYAGHTCAVNDDSAGFCWGYNDDGNLGDGTTEQRRRPTPIDDTQLAAVDHFSLSPFHTCAVDTAGAPYCWGSNGFGRLGDGTTTPRHVPTPVVTDALTAAARISTGEAHSCAVATTGEAFCWGHNGSWQLGDGTDEDRHVPTRVVDDALGAAGAVSAGGAHSCAIALDGSVYCWGSNDLGQLGDGTTENRLLPTPVGEGPTVYCALPGWLGVVPTSGTVPAGDEQLVDVTFDAADLAVGEYEANLCLSSNDPERPLTAVPVTLAVKEAGSVELMFDPSSLEFGDVEVGTSSPSQSATLENVGTGDATGLAFSLPGDDFDVDTSGCGESLPAGESCQVSVTFTPTAPGPAEATLGVTSSQGTSAFLALAGNGVVPPAPPQIDVDPASLASTLEPGKTEVQPLTVANLGDETLEWEVTQEAGGFLVDHVATGDEHACAVSTEGAVYCWGRNWEGQLGNGTEDLDPHPFPAPVLDPDDPTLPLKGVARVAAGGAHTCALTTEGTVLCWGFNGGGRLGTGDQESSPIPRYVVESVAGGAPLTGVADVTVGNLHTCAHMDDATAKCWGDNFWGQLGNPSLAWSSLPLPVVDPADTSQPLPGVEQLVAGNLHTCARGAGGGAHCWGWNIAGQLGNGMTSPGPNAVPRVVVDPADPSEPFAGVLWITAGNIHTCAVTGDDRSYCWGQNAHGQLGNDDAPNNSSVPSLVVDPDDPGKPLTGIARVTAGGLHACAITGDSTGYCWGNNELGQLGDGTNESSAVPSRIADPVDPGEAFSGLVGISPRQFQTCATVEGARAYCWGNNNRGQLGDGTTESRPLPAPVDSGLVEDCTLPAWAGAVPPSGSVPGGGEQIVDVAFDATGLEAGDFAANLCLASNDPAQPVAVIPLALAVLDVGPGGPVLQLTPDAFTFELTAGSGATQLLDVGNVGGADLHWEIVEAEAVSIGAASGSPVRAAPGAVRRAPPRAVPMGEILLEEIFADGEIPPPGWTHEVANGEFTWVINDNNPHAGDFYGSVFYDPDFIPQDEWLLTPPLSLNSAVLSFWSFGSLIWCRDVDDNCDLNVWIVLGEPGDADDVYVGRADDDWPEEWVWGQSVFDLSELLPGGEVRIGFQYVGNDGAQIALDSITLSGASAPVACVDPVDIPWLAVDPDSGITPAGGNTPVGVSVDTAGLEVGEHAAQVCVTTNDPNAPLATVPISLTVTEAGVPVLAFDPSSLDFGEVEVGSSESLAATLRNTGTAEATGLAFAGLPDGGFEAETGACGSSLPAGGSCVIDATFAPTGPGPAAATLAVTSDQDAAASLALSGHGLVDGTAFAPAALEVDYEPLASDGNEIFEPGESVLVAPAWRSDGMSPQLLDGDAVGFTGPAGASYTIDFGAAQYGLVEPGATASCRDTGICYELSVDDPAARPATLWVAALDEALTDGTTHTWNLHIGHSFTDVPRSSPFYRSIETLLHTQVTGGCSETAYCPTEGSTRGQMPVFVLRALEGPDYVPQACTPDEEAFADVPATSGFCPWIEELVRRQVVAGCGANVYCPNAPVNRQQMAIFLLRTLEGPSYTPPACEGRFTDLPCPSPFADWVEELARREITGGCAATEYCPTAPVNRQQMAVLVSEAFGLDLYEP